MAVNQKLGDRPVILYRFKDPRVGEFDVLNSASGWWTEHIVGPVKIQKLVDAYCFYYTDAEACSYAGITVAQLEYFQKLHPDFYGIKEVAKSQPDMHAKKKIVELVAKDPNWAAWWLQRTQKRQFSPHLDVTSGGERLNPQTNIIQFVNFKKEDAVPGEVVEPKSLPGEEQQPHAES